MTSTTTLHKLLEHAEWKEAQKLIEENPSLAHKVGSFLNCLPLLVAVSNKPPLSIVESLISANPNAVSAVSSYGHAPLRTSIRRNASKEVVQALLEPFPDAAKDIDKSGRSCLHYACLHSAEKEVIQKLLEAFPEAASMPDEDGFYPLALACISSNPSPDVIAALVDAYPQAASKAHSGEGLLALHLAALHGASPESLQLIYSAHPEAIETETESGYLPLHYACKKDVGIDTFKTVLGFYPGAAKVRGKARGYLPLHIAARNGAPIEVLRHLVQVYPDAVDIKNDDGETPVQSAERKGMYKLDLAATLAPFITSASHFVEGKEPANGKRVVSSENNEITKSPKMDLPSRLRSLEADHSRISDLAEELRLALCAEKEDMKKLRSDLATLSQLDVSSSFVPLACPPGVGVDSISQRRPV
mmetsp:Transcript_14819/g.21886  ORF Transcript_14819/g.21886 Transcript_14819/m.21886 type:complete len:417 (-) Transcript_14819:1725-2975(-)|eukprot:CAMPEP_0116014002 /NCGR_PEP_ID=MMETSP0321-20121206/6038_1 /TAXON_ID=163516 /ORGANISM="Leptocylindrus danicus var. danicus, Strain B650" /LENGTH=416 /DNA_ID=CAMNT_0003483611 /DNA_START=276 /DNA_END=1526 /DNA_ORIENTATION=-